MTAGLRIGELAALAGTTPRAVRHYHARGLVPEPERDAAGYRRYGAEHLVSLVRIRRLRSVGMPLEQIARSLGGTTLGPADLRTSLHALADELAGEIERLQDLRARVLTLAASGSLADPVEVWSAELRQRGLPADLPRPERDAVRLLDALHPQGITGVVATATP